MTIRTELTQARLRELLDYDPETGVFTRRVSMANCAAGTIAGNTNHAGYIRISIDDRSYRAHQLAWLYMTGEWPAKFIDHVDLNKGNNKWNNLREATKSQNQANTKAPKTNTSGYKGVHWYKPYGNWQVQIYKDRKAYFVGYFDDPAEGHRAYVAKAKELFGEYARAS